MSASTIPPPSNLATAYDPRNLNIEHYLSHKIKLTHNLSSVLSRLYHEVMMKEHMPFYMISSSTVWHAICIIHFNK